MKLDKSVVKVGEGGESVTCVWELQALKKLQLNEQTSNNTLWNGGRATEYHGFIQVRQQGSFSLSIAEDLRALVCMLFGR